MLPRAEYRALLRRARVFVCAPRREDYGIAQLEALADGCMLVTTPSPGPVRRAAASRARSTRASSPATSPGRSALGLDDPAPGYAERALDALAPWRPEAVDRVIAERPAPAVTVARMTPISGQSILITGAAHGIGAEVARRLAARGARVSLVGLGADELRRVAADCPGAIVFDADVTDREALDAAVAGTVEAFGGIDTVIANAGIGAPGFVRTMDPESFERVIEVNLIGVWRTIRACLPHVIERRGYILPVASMAAIAPAPGLAAYGAAKSGVEALGDALRIEVLGFGVRVGVAYFSWIDTELVRGADRTELGSGDAEHAQGPARAHLPRERGGRGGRARHRAPQPDRRLPALADRADRDPPAAPLAHRARAQARHRRVRPHRRARGRDARLGPGGRGRSRRTGRRGHQLAH